jgi:hypothetical protein
VIRSLNIGVNRIHAKSYPAPLNKILHALPYAQTSAEELAHLSHASSPIRLLGEEATHKGVLAALKELVGFAAKGDTIFVSFSGHGVRLTDTKGEELDGLSECWCLWDAVLRDDEIIAQLAEFPAKASVILVSDCCYSGGIVDLVGNNTSGIRAHVVAIAASSEFEQSYRATPSEGPPTLSSFVAVLAKALSLAHPPRTYRELAKRLAAELQKPPLRQDPSITAIGGLTSLDAAHPFWL